MADQRFIDATSLKVAVTRFCEATARNKRRKALRECVSELCRDICIVIDAELTADVRENVKGEWIWIEESKDVWCPVGRCSLCHCLHAGASNFCPNCGADMRGKSNEKYD